MAPSCWWSCSRSLWGPGSPVSAADARGPRQQRDRHRQRRHAAARLRRRPMASGAIRSSVDEVSPLYLQALMTYEDRWFRRHPGVNPVALLRAALAVGQPGPHRVRRLDPDHAGRAHPRAAAAQRRRASCDRCCARCNWNGICRRTRSWRSVPQPRAVRRHHRRRRGGELGLPGQAGAQPVACRSGPAGRAAAIAQPLAPRPPSPTRRAARATRCCARMATQGAWTPGAKCDDALIEPVVSRRLEPPMLAPLLAERLRRANPGRAQHRAARIDHALQRMLEERVADYFSQLARAHLRRLAGRRQRHACRRAPTSVRSRSRNRRAWATSTWCARRARRGPRSSPSCTAWRSTTA